jgi:hypothetical protein
MNITEQFLTKNKYSRPCTLLKAVKGIVIHWAANPVSTALANRNYFEGLKNQMPPNDKRFASAHYVGLQGEIIRCVPDKEVCCHAGADNYTNEAIRRLSSYPNNCTIGIELCHHDWSGAFSAETLKVCRNTLSGIRTHGTRSRRPYNNNIGVKMKCRSLSVFALLFFLFFFAGHPAKVQEDPLQTLSLNIRETLQTLKQQSISLQTELNDTITQLQTRSADLKLSENVRQRLTELSTSLQTSLTSMTEQSTKWYESSENYRLRLAAAVKWVITLALVLALRFIGMIAGYVLYARGVKLPRWFDILL